MKKIKNDSSQRLYEVNYLVGLREKERVLALVKKVEDWVERKEGEIIQVEKEKIAEKEGRKSKTWVEKRRLAYPIKKERAGYYLNSWIKIPPAGIDDFKRFLRLEKEIIRFAVLAESRIAENIQPVGEAVTLDEIDQLSLQQYSPRGEAARTERKTEPREIRREVRKEVVYQDAMGKKEEKEEAGKRKEPDKISEKIEKDKKIEAKEIKKEKVTAESELKFEKSVKPREELKKAAEETLELGKEREEGGEEPQGREESEVEDAEGQDELEKEPDEGKKEKPAKHKKISLEDLDKRLDDILNEDIL